VVISVSRVIVSVSSLAASLPFYEALGFTSFWSSADISRLRSGPVELMLHERGAEGSDLGVAVSFTVDDVDAATSAAVSAGGSLVDAPADQPWGERQSVLHDPDGHVICLVQPL